MEISPLRQALRMVAALGAGEVAARGIQTVGFILLARAVGPEMLGHWGFVGAVMAYGYLFVGLGMDAIAIRDSAARPDAAKDYLGWILGLRLTAAFLAFGGILLYVLFHEVRPVWMVLLAWQALALFGRAAGPRWRLMLDHHARPIAEAAVMTQIVYLLGVLTVGGDDDILRAAAAMGIGEAAVGAWLLRDVFRRFGDFKPRFDMAAWKRILVDGLPITLTRLMVVYRTNIHILLLRSLGTQAQLGVFVAGYRFVAVFGMLAMALRGGLYPSLSKEASSGGNPIGLAWRAAATIGALTAVAAAGIAIAAPLLMTRLFGPEFSSGIPTLRLLTLVIPMLGMRAILRQMMIVRHLERWDLTAMILVATIETVWAWIAVPTQGAMGTATAMVVGEATYAVLAAAALASGAGRYAGQD